MPHVADRFFHRHKPDPNDPAPLFDSGIGEWLLDLTAIAMIALIVEWILQKTRTIPGCLKVVARDVLGA